MLTFFYIVSYCIVSCYIINIFLHGYVNDKIVSSPLQVSFHLQSSFFSDFLHALYLVDLYGHMFLHSHHENINEQKQYFFERQLQYEVRLKLKRA